MIAIMDKEFLSITEIAQRLAVTRNTVKRLIDDGEIPAKRIGSQYRIRSRDFEDYLEKSNVKPKEPKE